MMPKKGTLSAWSWPSREVAYLKGTSLDINEYKNFIPKANDLQYTTPANHRELLNCIVNSDLKRVQDLLKSSIAISLRVDGSVDRMQVDNIHVMAKVVTADRNIELLFLGFYEPDTGGANGYYTAVQKAVERLMPWHDFFKLLSSNMTDGASINTGNKNGLWGLIDKDKQNSNSQILKIWCTVHRSALAWEKLTSNIPELQKLIEMCSSISSFFHRSGMCTKELKEIASKNKFNFIRLPAYFEVCWTEFTSSLLNSILRNWRALVYYFKAKIDEKTDQDCTFARYLSFLTDYNKLKLM